VALMTLIDDILHYSGVGAVILMSIGSGDLALFGRTLLTSDVIVLTPDSIRH